MELIYGDDSLTLDAACAPSGEQRVVLDAASLDTEAVTAQASSSLFGPCTVIIRNAAALDITAVGVLAKVSGTVILREDGKIPAKLRTAVLTNGGIITEHKLRRDPGQAINAAGRHYGVEITPAARRSLITGADEPLARSIIAACSVAGIRRVTERQVEALGGNSDVTRMGEVTTAVRRGDVTGALDAFARCDADPHALVGALRRSITGSGAESPSVIAELLNAELRLRSAARPAALWICVSRCADAFRSTPG